MSLKLKILLGGLLIIAGFLVIRVGMVFKGNIPTANILNVGQNVFTIKNEDLTKVDSDKDGIPDFDEAYYQTDPFNSDTDGDSFKDGEEIASGCSPIQPAPGDCLNSTHGGILNSKNITSELGKLITGGLFSGDLKNSQTNNNYQKNLELIKNKVILDLEDNLNDMTSSSNIKTSDTDQITVAAYIKNTKNILDKSLLKNGQDEQIKKGLALINLDVGLKNDIFAKLADSFSKSHKELLNLEVPANLKDSHIKLITDISRFANIFAYLADPSSDPIASVLSIDKLMSQFSKTKVSLQEINTQAGTIMKTMTYGALLGGGGIDSVPVHVTDDDPFQKYVDESEKVRKMAFDSLINLQKEVLKNIQNNGEGISGNKTISFVRDWRELLEGGQYRGENVFRAILADAIGGSNPTICPYLRQPLGNAFKADTPISGLNPAKYRVDSLQYFKIENQCTIPVNFNIDEFRQDFRNGGWDAWDRLLEPQNNIYGILNNSFRELSKQRGFEEEVSKNDAIAGSGFVSKRSPCVVGPSGTCVILGRIETPAKVLSATVQKAIDENYSWLISSDNMNDLTVDMANTLYDSLVDKLNNLSGLGSSNTGSFEGGGGTFGGGGASGNFGNSTDTGNVIQLPPGGLPGLP